MTWHDLENAGRVHRLIPTWRELFLVVVGGLIAGMVVSELSMTSASQPSMVTMKRIHATHVDDATTTASSSSPSTLWEVAVDSTELHPLEPSDEDSNAPISGVASDEASKSYFVHPSQFVSCFPTPPSSAANGSEYWSRSLCGVVFDGLSVLPFVRPTHGGDDPYHALSQRLITDHLLLSTQHLPHWDPFPRVLVVDAARGCGHLTREGNEANRTSGRRYRMESISDARTMRSLNVIWTSIDDLTHEASHVAHGLRGVFATDHWSTSLKAVQSRTLVCVWGRANVSAGSSRYQAVSSFAVMRWSPFQRTLFVNASSFRAPSKKSIAPPTLLFSLLDHFDMLLMPMPHMEEVLLKIQRAGCWMPMIEACASCGVLHDAAFVYPAPFEAATSSSCRGRMSSPGGWFVGNVFHTGFLLYKDTWSVMELLRSAAIFNGLRWNGRFVGGSGKWTAVGDRRDLLPTSPSPPHRNATICDAVYDKDDLWDRSMALFDAIRCRTSCLDDVPRKRGQHTSQEVSYTIIDPVHCADWRWGMDPCGRITNRPSHLQKQERQNLFRCDEYRV